MVVKFFRNPFVGSSLTTKLSCFFSQRTNFRRVSMGLEPQLTQDGTNLTQAQYRYLAGGIFTCCEPPLISGTVRFCSWSSLIKLYRPKPRHMAKDVWLPVFHTMVASILSLVALTRISSITQRKISFRSCFDTPG